MYLDHRLHHTLSQVVHHTCSYLTIMENKLLLGIIFTSKYNVMYTSYEDGDTKDVRVRIQQHTSANGEGDGNRGLSTLFAKPYRTAPHEQKIFLSLSKIAMACILWLQSYMYNRTTNYCEGMII